MQMSEKNRDGKRTARERLVAEREAQRARDLRRKKLGVLGAVAAVVAAAVGVGIAVQNHRSEPETPMAAPTGALGARKLVIPVGPADAPSVLTVYEDPRCPACDLFEKEFRGTVESLMDQGKIFGNYHIVSFIDRHDGGHGSKYAANALGCAQDAGRFRAYHDVLYANQPDETEDVWRDRGQLIHLAGQVPGLATSAFKHCVMDDRYAGWVSSVEQDFDKSGFTSTPTVLLNGEPVFPRKGNEPITPANLVKWVDAANRGKPLGTATATAPGATPATPAASATPSAPGAVSGAGAASAPGATAPASPVPGAPHAPVATRAPLGQGTAPRHPAAVHSPAPYRPAAQAPAAQPPAGSAAQTAAPAAPAAPEQPAPPAR